MANLDIAEFKLNADHLTVTSEHVRFRLLLARVDAASFCLEGAKRITVVESDEALTLRKVLSTAEQALREKLPSDIVLTPHRGSEFLLPVIGPMDRVLAAPTVKTPVPSTGLASTSPSW